MLIALGSLMPALPARAESATYLYQGQTIVFSHVATSDGVTMVGIQDPGLRALLKALGAIVTWKPGHRYVLITTSEPEVISFSVGDRSYDVGPVTSQASVAPFARAQDVYLPLDALLRALYLAPKADGLRTILQPQLGSIDVRAAGSQATLVAHAGAPLKSRIVSESAGRIVYEFDGVGSTLERRRSIDAGGIRSLEVTSTGTLLAPKTLVTVTLAPGAQHGRIHDRGGNDFEVAFTGSSSGALPNALARASTVAPSSPAPVPSIATESATQNASGAAGPVPQTSAAPAQINAVSVTQTADGSSVTIAVSGNATYDWHRLRAPDNRFWVDIQNAQLTVPPSEQAEVNPLMSMRVRQDTPTTVRIALSLVGQNVLAVSPSATGLTIAVNNQQVADAAREGSGSVGSVVSVTEAQPAITPAPLNGSDENAAAPWKFGPQSTYVPTNPKLIVIDPGHGGSDRGAVRNGTDEATLTLDMAKRLRDILIARGWQVKMTRSTDVDVYAPNDSAHDELQARVNIANDAGARLFVSIHVNAFINSGPHGTTTYYSKPQDAPLARIVQQDVATDAGTKDDGIVKSHLYVTLHTYMPAILIETAFLSNPDDYALLVSPAWRQRVAEAIADGIDQYTQQYPAPSTGGQ
ncbi:MAG: N-acetylmuramoyl-L-alanine amidase [Vulcanimicrobiaceae bacterium]